MGQALRDSQLWFDFQDRSQNFMAASPWRNTFWSLCASSLRQSFVRKSRAPVFRDAAGQSGRYEAQAALTSRGETLELEGRNQRSVPQKKPAFVMTQDLLALGVNIGLRILSARVLIIMALALDAIMFGWAMWLGGWDRLAIAVCFAVAAGLTVHFRKTE